MKLHFLKNVAKGNNSSMSPTQPCVLLEIQNINELELIEAKYNIDIKDSKLLHVT
jgi:hypothetical protein